MRQGISLLALLLCIVVWGAAAWAQPGLSIGGGRLQGAARVAEVTATGGGHSREPLRFVAIGDFGDGTSTQATLASRMCKWHTKHPFGIAVATGDNIYPDGSEQYFQSRFFDPYSCLETQGIRWHAVLGNHDVRTEDGRPELDTPAFGLRGRNYVLRRRHVRLVFADSNELRMAWLKRALRTKPEDRWTVVIFHYPVYSAGPHFPIPGFIPRLPRLFVRRGVDLVISGHDHLYSQSRRLDGIRYVVTGAGGEDLHDCIPRSFIKTCFSRTHFLYVKAGRKEISVSAVGMRGVVFARFRTRGRD